MRCQHIATTLVLQAHLPRWLPLSSPPCPQTLTGPHSSTNTLSTWRHAPLLKIKQVEDDDVDDPDHSLRLGEGLREHTGGEIKTVVASAADAGIYRSAAAFEDIITDKHLLQVRGRWWGGLWLCVGGSGVCFCFTPWRVRFGRPECPQQTGSSRAHAATVLHQPPRLVRNSWLTPACRAVPCCAPLDRRRCTMR